MWWNNVWSRVVAVANLYSYCIRCLCVSCQALCFLFGGVSTYLYITLLPFYRPSMNIANIIHSMVFVFATVLLTCAWVRGVPEVRRH